MNEKQNPQDGIMQTDFRNKLANNEAERLVLEKVSPATNDGLEKEMTNNVKTQKNNIYVQSFAGLACLALIIILFFYIAIEENWYKMTSSCGHTAWIGFFLFGVPLFAGAVAFEASALSRRRNLLSIFFLVIIIVGVAILLMIYSNMNSTASGC